MRLSRYASELMPTEQARIHFFVDQLKLDRQRKVDSTTARGGTLGEIVEEIRRQELFDRRAREAGDKRPRHQGSY